MQTSGFNPESDTYMVLGYSHWALFSVPSAYAIMLSVTYIEAPLLIDATATCDSDGSLQLFQEHLEKVETDTGGYLNSKRSAADCEIPLNLTQSDSSVIQITLNGSSELAGPNGFFDSERFALTARNIQCGRLKEVWKVCEHVLPEPFLSESNLRLHVLSELGRKIAQQRRWEGFRAIFTFHQVRLLLIHV